MYTLLKKATDTHIQKTQVCDLLEYLYHHDPKVYQSTWLPYLSTLQKEWHEPLCTCMSLEELNRWIHIAPFARFKLQLKAQGIQNAAAISISQHSSLRNVHTLDVSHNQIETEGALALLCSHKLDKLIQLDLSANQLKGETAKQIAKAHISSHLRILRLNDNNLGEQGLQELLQSKSLRHLRVLSLKRTPL